MKDSKQIPIDECIYEDSISYISDELKKIDLLLEFAISKQRITKGSTEKDTIPGLYISEKEIESLLNEGSIKKGDAKNYSCAEDLIHAIENQRNIIAYRSELTRKKGIILPIDHLKNLFSLTPFEIDILFLCLAPMLDTRYEKLYAYLQDDVLKRYPTLNLISILFNWTFKEQVIIRHYFSEHAPLIHWQLIKLGADNNEPSMSLLSRPICIDEHIVDFLLGSHLLDPAIAEIISVIEPEADIEALYINEDLKQKLKNLIRHLQAGNRVRSNTIISFYGQGRICKEKAASAISFTLNIPLLQVNATHLIKNEETFYELVKRITKEVLLHQSSLLIKDFDVLLSEDVKINHFREHLLKYISKFFYLTFITSERNWFPKEEIDNARHIKIHFPLPDFKLRKKIWEKALNDKTMINLTPDILANKFKFTEDQINASVATAKDLTFFHPLDNDVITDEDLLIASQQQDNQKLSELALKITPKFCWQDIVLPKDKLAQLKEICNQIKYRHIVYGEWGFNKKCSTGKGLNVLFSGSSGTGKTMAAEILANELKLELYKIDLSQVVSKYIGETEKNLNRIFKEAQTSNAILFFDEADALFGKRSEVKDAHDRYANIEIGYLLQKMDEYEGITILATNMRQNIDDAFIRRMQFIVEFPFPDEKHRELIWKIIFPKETPLSNDIDYNFLSKRLKISGGNIKNIALTAAFYAASDSLKIGMHHIMQAVKREYQKMGKPFLDSDFEPYDKLIGKK